MKVALFVPCYVDQLFPQVAIASLQLLENFGCQVSYPLQQVCCGQPMANAGYFHLTERCKQNFLDTFKGVRYVVSPSGS